MIIKKLEMQLRFLIKKTLVLLQCSSIYPCPLDKVGLNVLSEFRKKFKCEVGFSDHTNGFAASVAAASIGASVIEKHFTLSRKMYGSDAKNSMELNEFKFFTNLIKDIWFIKNKPVDKNKIKNFKNMKLIFEKRYLRKKKYS